MGNRHTITTTAAAALTRHTIMAPAQDAEEYTSDNASDAEQAEASGSASASASPSSSREGSLVDTDTLDAALDSTAKGKGKGKAKATEELEVIQSNGVDAAASAEVEQDAGPP